MSTLLGVDGLSHEWPGKQVFLNQSKAISAGDVIGIVGANGDGKSTLLKVLAGRLEPDEGRRTQRFDVYVDYVGQRDDFAETATLNDIFFSDTPAWKLLQQPSLREIFTHLVGDISVFSQIATLSGGQRRRVDLARALTSDANILLLDEPTNHLDITTINWLAEALKQRLKRPETALVLVSHDRWFIDELATQIWEVHDGVIDTYEGGFSAYIQQRFEREQLEKRMEAKRQNFLRKELVWLATQPKARTSKPQFRIKEAEEIAAQSPPLRKKPELFALASARLGKQVIDLEQVSFSYVAPSSSSPDSENTYVINNLDLSVGPGERLGILGNNGSGKSTLLKLICQELMPTSGKVKIGKSVEIGLLSQNLDNLLKEADLLVSELLKRYKSTHYVDGKPQSTLQLFERLGFIHLDLQKRLKDLSGGQLRKLALLCVLIAEPNVLILDEPGNDLDCDMLSIVEDILDGWPATLIMVSHDRHLIERVCDDQVALIGATLQPLIGGVDEFLARASQVNDSGRSIFFESLPNSEKSTAPSNNKRIFELKKYIAKLERQVRTAEAQLAELHEALAQTDPFDFEALAAAQHACDLHAAEISTLEDTWMQALEELESYE